MALIYDFTLEAQSDDQLPLLINDWFKTAVMNLIGQEHITLQSWSDITWRRWVLSVHVFYWLDCDQNLRRLRTCGFLFDRALWEQVFLPFLMWWKSDNVLLKMSIFQTRREAKQIHSVTGFKRGAHIKVHKSMSALMNLTSTKLFWPFHPFKQTFTWRRGTLKNPGAICMSLPITLALAWSPLWTE